LRLVVVVVFAAAVWGLYQVVQTSGILAQRRDASPVYSDVPVTNPYRLRLEAAAERGLVPPVTTVAFRPFDRATRADLALALATAMQWEPGVAIDRAPYEDTGAPLTAPAQAAVASVTEHGVMAAIPQRGGRIFAPGGNVSLEQMIVAFVRAARGELRSPTAVGPTIAALEVGETLREALQIAFTNQLFDDTGLDIKTVDFKTPATRQHLATFALNVAEVRER